MAPGVLGLVPSSVKQMVRCMSRCKTTSKDISDLPDWLAPIWRNAQRTTKRYCGRYGYAARVDLVRCAHETTCSHGKLALL